MWKDFTTRYGIDAICGKDITTRPKHQRRIHDKDTFARSRASARSQNNTIGRPRKGSKGSALGSITENEDLRIPVMS